MSVQLLSINHKSADTVIRGRFGFDEDKQRYILQALTAAEEIEEAVILVTCSRTEIYCCGSDDNRILRIMQDTILSAAGAEEIPGIREMIFRFTREGAVHHLFMVTAGLDSLVLGEDQILGQVKKAYYFAKELGCCGTVFNLMFRQAITAAKRIKTDTGLSKTSVSTASLALKCARDTLGTLSGKNILIIGAAGKIGGIVLKDALDIEGANVYITVHRELPHDMHGRRNLFTVIPYHERYEQMGKMDVIISATRSPHYTVTRERFQKKRETGRKYVFFDLAVPSDIEADLSREDQVFCFNMEDMKCLARENNEKKQSYVAEAKEILHEYEEEFIKSLLYSKNLPAISSLKEETLRDVEEKSAEKAIDRLMIKIREESTREEFEAFVHVLQRLNTNL